MRFMLASRHPILESEGLSKDLLAYLRTWLTETDNGVNGNKSSGKSQGAIPGTSGEAMAIHDLVKGEMSEFCGENRQVNESFCADLKSLASLSLGIMREARMQSESGLKGSAFY